MTDALDRACEAAWGHEANISDFPAYPSRGSIAAALRVIAEDVRKQTSVWRSNDGGGDMDANALEVQVMLLCADQIDLIIDAYVGDINDQ